MPVIAVVGNKGGAGKTTLSINLATGLAKQYSIAVVDADPQGSALQWRAFADHQDSIPVFEANDAIAEQVAELLQDYDYVVIDCPPSVHAPQTNAVLEFCDLALIPVQPSPVDLWATVHIEQAIDRAHATNPSLQAMLVINQIETRTTLSRLVREALSAIALPVANTSLRRRAVYRNSALEGKSVYDMGRRGADAVDELEQLIQEVTSR
ncbi:MAG: ParA family partition ATPase [Granulosicoccaceae bacterium]|jgi:chromosome partitioning protein